MAAVTSLQVPSLTSWQWSPRPGRAPRIVPARATGTGTVAPWVRDAVPPGKSLLGTQVCLHTVHKGLICQCTKDNRHNLTISPQAN